MVNKVKILFQNRANAFEKWGGDTTQMVETKNHLEKYDIDIKISLEANPDVSNYDLIHIFNIQGSEYGIKQVLNAKYNKKPVALSTIYWDFTYFNNIMKEGYIYSENHLIKSLANINQNIPNLLIKFLNFNKSIKEKKYARLMLKESDILLPNSYSELEIISLSFKMPEIRQKSVIIPNGISTSKFQNNNSSESLDILKFLPDEYVLEVANFGIWKGQLKVISALLEYPKIPLVFIGNLESTYAKECIKLGNIRGNTYFLGEIPHEEIYPYFSNAKVHVLPSFRESPGLSTLEAAVFGANCVVSFHGPIAEYFGLDIFCCDPKNVESIKNAILKAWNSPKKNNLKNRILNEFTWANAALKTFNAYKHVLNNKKNNKLIS